MWAEELFQEILEEFQERSRAVYVNHHRDVLKSGPAQTATLELTDGFTIEVRSLQRQVMCECGNSVVSSRPNQKFCSKKCRVQAGRAAQSKFNKQVRRETGRKLRLVGTSESGKKD